MIYTKFGDKHWLQSQEEQINQMTGTNKICKAQTTK
jgi:hypothetical protein